VAAGAHPVNQPSTGVRRIDHVGVAVHDLPAASRFLTTLLHMDAAAPVDLPEQGVRVQFHTAGDDQIELLQPTAGGGALARFLERRGEGLHHVGYRVDDVAAVLEAVRAAGGRLIDEAPRPGSRGTTVAFVHPKGSLGTLIELVQE
jgi:methylmalonyl-CoA epimerase